jgi:hypothetical protein
MMDWIAGAYSGVKAATDITQSMLRLKTDAEVTTKVIELNGVLIELQQKLFEAQEVQFKLMEENRALRTAQQKESRFDDYRLIKTALGAFILQLKDEKVSEDRPIHHICSVCAEKDILSVLNQGPYQYTCPACTTVFRHTKRPSLYGNR